MYDRATTKYCFFLQLSWSPPEVTVRTGCGASTKPAQKARPSARGVGVLVRDAHVKSGKDSIWCGGIGGHSESDLIAFRQRSFFADRLNYGLSFLFVTFVASVAFHEELFCAQVCVNVTWTAWVPRYNLEGHVGVRAPAWALLLPLVFTFAASFSDGVVDGRIVDSSSMFVCW